MDTASKIKNFSLILIGVILLANIILLDFMVVDLRSKSTPTPVVKETNSYLTPPVVDSCPVSCLMMMVSATRSAAPKQTLPAPVVSQPAAAPPVVVPATNQKGEYFINLGTGSVSNTESSGSNWKTIDSAQATFDAANYGNIKSATLEVFMHMQSAGEVHARLLDTTTPAIFWSADLLATSTTSTYKSGPITLSSGSKTYKIQMYSTLSTGYLDQARIHIVTQ